jgi:aspartate kinase
MCEIYTDVSGVYTADPRIVPGAIKLDTISYDEMLELTSLGARILHTRCVELAKKFSVQLHVRSSMTYESGTIVKEEKSMEKLLVSGVTIDKNVARVSAVGVKDEPGIAFRLFSVLAKANISVDIILQSTGRNNTQDISFTVAKDDLASTLDVLNTNKDSIGGDVFISDEKIAKLSVVGAGMATNPGVASLLFESLYDAGVNIQMISTSEIKISVLINEADAERAARFVHEKFLEN